MATNMTFVDFVTPVPADWLNNVNFVVNQYPYAASVINYTYPSIGTTRTIQDKFSKELVSVLDFGAKGDGVTDDTAAIQAAINTGKTVYIPKPSVSYLVKNAITVSTTGQKIYGDGKNVSVILVNNTFNLSATGVFVFTSGEPGPELSDFQISFVQPDTAVRANLTAYPPAIYAQGIPRFRISNFKIINAMVGIDMRLNCGGAHIIELDISAFTVSIWIDGSVDTVRLDKVHNWPFSLTTNTLTIFNNPATVGLQSGRMDDLNVTDSLFFCGTAVFLYVGTEPGLGGSTFGSFVGCDFDTNANFTNNGAGQIQFVACDFTIATTATGWYLQEQVGAQSFFTNCIFLANAVPAQPVNIVQGQCRMSGCYFATTSLDFTHVIANNTTTVQLIGNHFSRTSGITYTQPTIQALTGSRLTASANRTDDKGAGASIFIAVAADNYHNITGNSAVGWSYSNPTISTMVFANNN